MIMDSDYCMNYFFTFVAGDPKVETEGSGLRYFRYIYLRSSEDHLWNARARAMNSDFFWCQIASLERPTSLLWGPLGVSIKL